MGAPSRGSNGAVEELANHRRRLNKSPSRSANANPRLSVGPAGGGLRQSRRLMTRLLFLPRSEPVLTDACLSVVSVPRPSDLWSCHRRLGIRSKTGIPKHRHWTESRSEASPQFPGRERGTRSGGRGSGRPPSRERRVFWPLSALFLPFESGGRRAPFCRPAPQAWPKAAVSSGPFVQRRDRSGRVRSG